MERGKEQLEEKYEDGKGNEVEKDRGSGRKKLEETGNENASEIREKRKWRRSNENRSMSRERKTRRKTM